jgi:hypothetical protein
VLKARTTKPRVHLALLESVRGFGSGPRRAAPTTRPYASEPP